MGRKARMRLIVGLGNPGREYDRTRHNVGFRVVDAFAAKFRMSFDIHEKDALIARGRVAGTSVMLARPLTYMNRSGSAVAALCRSYTETLDEMLVVYDDIDLPLGKLRIRANGSPGTHNGMKSIVEALDSEQFPRLRVGIRGEKYDDLADYVLNGFEPAESVIVEQAVDRSLDALLLFARGELARAMNQFNRDPEPPSETT